MAKVALLIGVSEYKPGLNPLPAAVKDVEAMRRVLLNSQMGNFAVENITVLENPQPLEMQYAIYNLFANRQRDDLVLLYFSGHGIKDESGRLYLASRETYKENGGLVKPSAVEARQLHDNMNESRSERQVIILDCCFSGAIAKGLTVKDDGKVDLQTQLGGKGRAILTSSTSTQYSFAEEGSELSVYTRYLVEGIEKGAADQDGDGWITVDELHDYACGKVKEASPAMTPKFYPVEEGYKIRLAKAPVDDPYLKYRKEVENIAKENEGEISRINRSYLNELRNNWSLRPEESDNIEAEVLRPYLIRQDKLRRYEQVFTEVIQQQNSLTQRDRKELKRLQQALNLRDEDIAPIEKRITRQTSRLSLPQILTRQQFIRLAGFGGAGLLGTIVVSQAFREDNQPKNDSQPSVVPSPSANETKLQQFEFPVVKVDAKGKITSRTTKNANFFTEDLGNGVTLDMVEIPGGKFVMGSPSTEKDRSNSESPQHNVTIKPFFMGKFTITQQQYQAIMGKNPSNFKGEKHPVEQVSWDDAIAFCAELSKTTGKTYRLPSEAEWEYACRGWTTTPFYFGETITTDLANYRGTDWNNSGTVYNGNYGQGPKGIYRQETTEVGKFPPNACGLYDMHGNIWEWCQDTWHDSYEGAPDDGTAWVSDDKNNTNRLLRGGSWDNLPRSCRSAFRHRHARDYWYNNVGFRVVVVGLARTI
ncbi:SUMF1/EgtB/PvdO family nonheme iron enzyme [Aetokthonos hydrillicola Thurmond2011]|jgi:formylglycine-generating enzyme required for sulfatase activity/uncharacterized caspase-like protein|uniref:SUMF1/EgtB/PvdO family nonheme iron enzyme n=1 Tax=Aetokthonos hydrillicola Thurmond2011 TaxID=2712845 RepID=A0AAP5I2T5_9CYAN|nr:SUMF1/EgtB/PvdO family nonheme iron enzyme [Aetokthonos hydrillicola]MBO3457449.1 SUMF1/EgtB/PvdO family nonheme iron enzyme [Aetokthonos hydrillicola CCALA 1050]MBW4586030.1 SUMF1/EgtB/PvdO family nonheme iron enzyme [Aetokthonos hydrillicola CCALA 1050]MDR9893744.1 SUMF1/EgtB/PvdO family nonheme iron enzyme [Aetokthonos hydrillicola Thurmond2011]